MSSHTGVTELVELAVEQAGLVTSRQARSQLGTTPQELKRLADSGVLERLHHGIYRLSRLPHDRHLEQRLAWMALDQGTVAWDRLDQPVPTGVLSHRTAAGLHDLGDVDSDEIELTATRRIRLSIPDVRVHRGDLDREDWQLIDGLPVTTAVRTIADLAAAALDAGHLASIVSEALTRDLVGVAEVVAALAPCAFDYGHRALDGQGFLDSLIDQAGVPDTTVAVADLVRRQSAHKSASESWQAFAASLSGPQLEEVSRQMRALGSAVAGPAVQDMLRDVDLPRINPSLTGVDHSRVSEAMKAISAVNQAPLVDALNAYWASTEGPHFPPRSDLQDDQ